MAQRMKQATRSARAVQDGADTDALIPGSFPHHYRHGTNSIYPHDSQDLSSSSLLADDEDSSAGSPDEVDGELW
jgi:hypothetical protein